MRDIIFDTSGHTLMEMLLVILISALIVLPLLTFFNANYTTFMHEISIIEAQQIGRMGLDHIVTNLRKAEQDSIEKMNDTSIRMIVRGSVYEYYFSKGIVYQKIGNTSNQLMHNVKLFFVYEDEEIINIDVIIMTDDMFKSELNFSNSYRIRF